MRFLAKIAKLNYLFWSPKMSNREKLLARKFSNCQITKFNSRKIFHKLVIREIWSFCLIQCLLICMFSRPSINSVICAKKVFIFTYILKRLSRGYVSIFSPWCVFFSTSTIFYQIFGSQNLLNLPDEGTSWVKKIPENNGGRWDKCTARWEYLLRSFSKPQINR